MRSTPSRGLQASLERRLPERRVFIRSRDETRLVRLRSGAQLALGACGCAAIGAGVLATAMLVAGGPASGPLRDQAQREQAVYEARLEALSSEREGAANRAVEAEARFDAALRQVSAMQAQLLEAEGRLLEADTGLEAVQSTLRGAMRERDAARAELAAVTGESRVESATAALRDSDATVDVLSGALRAAADERDAAIEEVAASEARIDAMTLDARAARERNERIFSQLEEAVATSMEPLERLFAAAGVPTEEVIAEVRRGYSGQGGPLELIAAAAGPEVETDAARANAILRRLDEVNVYRLAAAQLPFADPVPSGAYRLTSGFGPRQDPMGGGNGRMHSGVDFAGASGTPIHATADGVVIRAGRMGGYGNVIDIQHSHGLVTRYAHLSSIGVERGQNVSRGERIGGMGTTGRSTGVHLHYEVHANGKPVNPMTYIRAARDVF